jgi:hypothetical protein
MKEVRSSHTSPEFDAFTSLVDQVLSVPREEVLRREAEYRKQSEQNPRKRGPKRKFTKPPSASPDAART